MPSLKSIFAAAAVGFAAFSAALPAHGFSSRSVEKTYSLRARQNALAAAAGISDVDILQLYVLLHLSLLPPAFMIPAHAP